MRNAAPPGWDDAWYLSNSLSLYDTLVERGAIAFGAEFFRVMGFKAPLITALPVPFYLVLGRDWHHAFGVNAGSMLALFVALYRIGVRLANPTAGLLAVAISGTMPLLYGLSTWYLVEYTLAAWVAVTILLLMRASDFEDPRAAVLLGAALGVGLMLKASFAVFVAAPIAYALYQAQRRMRAIILMLAPCALVAAPWYILHGRETLRNAIDAAYGAVPTAAQGTGAILSFGAIASYAKNVGLDGLSILYVVLLVVFVRRSPRIIGLWLAPLPVFVFAGNKDLRYPAPIFPALALLLAISMVDRLGKRAWLAWLAPATAGLMMAATLFGWPYNGDDHRYARRFDPSDWSQDRIGAAIAAAGVNQGSTVLLAVDRQKLNANNVELTLRQLRVPGAVETTAYHGDLQTSLNAADAAGFVLVKEGGEPEGPVFNRYAQQVAEHVQSSPSFAESFSVRLPDGAVARLYKRVPLQQPGGMPVPRIRTQFGEYASLEGFEAEVKGRSVSMVFEWRSLKPFDREYWCFVHLLDADNRIVGQLDHRLPRPSEWQVGQVFQESFRHTLAGAPPSHLRVRFGVYHVPTDQRLRVTAETGELTDDGTALIVPVAKDASASH